MSRELLQQALNALENGKRVRAFEGGTKYQPDLEDSAITAIRAHLAAQPAPAEPVAWRWRQRPHESKAWGDWFVNLNTPPRQKTSDTFEVEPLCVAAQPAPVPLTHDDIWLLWTRACEKPQLTRDLVCDFARAIEAAHGIAASPEKKP